MEGIREALPSVDERIREDVRHWVRIQVGIFRDSHFRFAWCPADIQPSDFWE